MTQSIQTPITADVEIRRICEHDSFEDLTALLHRAYAPLYAMGCHFIAATQSVEVTRRRAAKGECYVGMMDGRIVATVNFRPGDFKGNSPWLDLQDVSMFGQFAVEPPLQGRGIGKQLITLCERRAAETGAAELALATAEPAGHLIQMYERMGFRFIEHVRWPDLNYRSVVMSKGVGR